MIPGMGSILHAVYENAHASMKLPLSIHWLHSEPKVSGIFAANHIKKWRTINLVALSCTAAACFEPGDCIFTAGLTAVAFHSGDRWQTFSLNDTESLQSSALMDPCGNNTSVVFVSVARAGALKTGCGGCACVCVFC